jgi:cytoplasmic iron level regulating protein YaaA (DUF328/UPF0246 family)
MQMVYLVACVSKKKSQPTVAELMYQSVLFLKASEYARRHGDRWYILSAKYGLLAPDTRIEPYDKTLAKGMPVNERKQWARNVLSNLMKVTVPDETLVFLAGQKYREYLIPHLTERGYNIEIPMEGLAIGEQLAWLKQQLS